MQGLYMILQNPKDRALRFTIPGKEIRQQHQQMAKHGEIPSQPTRFFKVILPSDLQSGALELPRLFVTAQGKHSKFACLKVPNGEETNMELKMSRNRAWLHKGWREFVDKYSIQSGYLLNFKYQGKSRFKVIIFDLSCTEIKYPVNKDDSDEEVLKTKASDKRPKAMKRVESFKSGNPHFRILINSTYIRRASVHIPSAHAQKYLKEDGRGKEGMTLYGLNGRSWNVEYNHRARQPHSRARRVVLTNGWMDFMRDNHLQKGDCIIFERMSGKAKDYKVTIFSVGDNA